MGPEGCVVCGGCPAEPVEGRPYCARHRERLGTWWRRTGQATAVLVLGLAALVAVASWAAQGLRGTLGPRGLTAVGCVLALVPAALWLLVFHVQDRENPEPKWLLLRVCVLGGLVAGAVGQPVIRHAFQLGDWAEGGLLVRIAAAVLVVGTVQEFLKYVVVRHSVYASREYDEPIDGVVYAAAAGLGYAAVADVTWVLRVAGADIGYVAWRSTIDALAQASSAGVAGYFLGRTKFEERPAWWMPAGLVLACVLNGFVATGLGVLSRSGLDATPTRGLLFAAAVAAVTFAVLLRLMRGGVRPARTEVPCPAAFPPLASASRRRERLVVLVALAMLAGGWALRATQHRAAQTVSAAGFRLDLPRDWAVAAGGEVPEALRAMDALSPSAFPTRITLVLEPVAAPGEGPETLDAFVMVRTAAPAADAAASFTVIEVQRAGAVGKAAATRIDYGYVAPPRDGAPPSALPVVVRAQDLVFRSGDAWCVLTFAAEESRFYAERWIWDRALATLSLP